METDTYEDLVKVTAARKCSMAALLRAYIEAGLYADKDHLK